jgi:hypothetical protein
MSREWCAPVVEKIIMNGFVIKIGSSRTTENTDNMIQQENNKYTDDQHQSCFLYLR